MLGAPKQEQPQPAKRKPAVPNPPTLDDGVTCIFHGLPTSLCGCGWAAEQEKAKSLKRMQAEAEKGSNAEKRVLPPAPAFCFDIQQWVQGEEPPVFDDQGKPRGRKPAVPKAVAKPKAAGKKIQKAKKQRKSKGKETKVQRMRRLARIATGQSAIEEKVLAPSPAEKARKVRKAAQGDAEHSSGRAGASPAKKERKVRKAARVDVAAAVGRQQNAKQHQPQV